MQGAEKSMKDSLQPIYSVYIKSLGLFNMKQACYPLEGEVR